MSRAEYSQRVGPSGEKRAYIEPGAIRRGTPGLDSLRGYLYGSKHLWFLSFFFFFRFDVKNLAPGNVNEAKTRDALEKMNIISFSIRIIILVQREGEFDANTRSRRRTRARYTRI